MTDAAQPEVLFTTSAELAAEREVVGICLRWSERIREVDLDADCFAIAHWRAAFRALRALDGDRQPISELSVAAALEKLGVAMVPLSMLFEASNAVLSGTNVAHYAALVKAGSVRRALATACADVLEGARRNHPPDELLSDALRQIAALHVERPGETLHVVDMLKQRFTELAAMSQAKSRGEQTATGIPTGLEELDALTGGIQRGIVTVAAGRPGMGKSSFALTCVRNATKLGVGCHVFSLEDTREAYSDRIIAGEADVPAEALRTLSISHEQQGRISWAMNRIGRDTPWLVEDRSGISADEIVRSVRRRIAANKTRLVVVDYVQLLRAPRDVRRGEEAITYSMNVLADAAKQDGISYLVLAQLNRECERRDNKRPMLSDLKQAGTIEERAKAVFFLYRPSVYGERDENKQPISERVIEVLIAKNNQGRTGCAMAAWDGETMRMR